MGKSGLIAVSVFLVVFMVWSVSADCQYKISIESNKSVSNLYINGTKQINPLEVKNYICSWGLGRCGFEVFSNIDVPVNARVEYFQGLGTRASNIYVLPYQYTTVLSNDYEKAEWTIDLNTIEFKYQSNNYSEARWDKEQIAVCKQCLGTDCLNDGQSCQQDFQCGSNICSNTGNTNGFCVSERNNFEQRISVLESWKNTITDTISQMWLALTGYSTRLDNLENHNATNKNVTPNYFKYLSSSDRKGIVCGYAQDNHLNSLVDIGWNCTVTYKQTSRGETSSCKCKEFKG